MAFENINTAYSTGVKPSIIEYHEKALLENVKKNLVYCKDLQKRTLPKNSGERVKFRKMTPFAPITEPLQEGVTPPGQKLEMTSLTAVVKPYGRHIELTDEMDWQNLDNMQREAARLLSDQAAESIDKVARNALNAGLNVQYTGSNTKRSTITAADKLTYADVKKAVRTLKKNNAKRFPDGCYHAIVGPDTVFDLTSDPMWVDVAKYQDKEKVETYELGKIYGVKFYESTESMVFKAAEYLFGTTASIALMGYDKDNRMLTAAAAAFGEDQKAQVHNARTMIGQMADLSRTVSSAAVLTTVTIEDITFEGENAKIKLRWAPEDYAAHVSGAALVPAGGGAEGAEVHSTLVYGQDFGGCVELEGNGKNVSIIIKPAGSSGAEDPLDQRSTIAWKVKGFCAVILQDAFGVRIEHGVTA